MQRWQPYILAALLVIGLIGNYKGIALSDEYLYAEQAVALAHGYFEWTNSAFANRFGQLLPMALLVELLGPKPGTMVLWSSICLIALVLVFRIWAQEALEERAAWTAVFLLVLNPSLLFYGADVSHDLVMSAFSFFALYLLCRRIQPGWMAACLAWAFLTKMAVLFLMPFFLWVAWWDIRRGRCIPFWRTTALLGLGFVIAFFGLYEVAQGDWLFRFRGIAQEHNISEWSYYQKSLSELWQRLTVGPAAFIAQSPGLGIPFVLAGLWIFRFNPRKLDELPNFLFGFILSTLAVFWWGSTSLSSYNPMLLAERMWLVFIPPCTLLGVYSLQELSKGLKSVERHWLPLLGILGLLGCGAGAWTYGMERPFFMVTLLGILFTWVFLARNWTIK
ncbi:MAG: glycosyltransferase family 39 protein, partial [Phaeodactylibacter sp.]|nr:glycosyltransferase family 39 protein [Phaeodactylibacter sp.]